MGHRIYKFTIQFGNQDELLAPSETISRVIEEHKTDENRVRLTLFSLLWNPPVHLKLIAQLPRR